ncbi:unnamed protein product [Aphanomyces euteiches]
MSGSSNPSLLSSSQTPGNVRPAKLPVDQRTATHSDNSQPKSNSSQPKSDPNRIVKGEINGLTFQVEIVDPSSIFALAPCRDIDEETDYSYVEPEPMITAMASPDSPRTDSEITIKGKKSDAITSKYTQQLDELEMRVKELQVDDLDGHEEQFGNTSDYSEYSDVQPAHPPYNHETLPRSNGPSIEKSANSTSKAIAAMAKLAFTPIRFQSIQMKSVSCSK